MKSFLKGFGFGFAGIWTLYFIAMAMLNMVLWFCTSEVEMAYQPVYNIFELM